MGLFDRIFRRPANTNVEEIVAEPGESFIIGAERVADIITQGIEKGDLSEVSIRLDSIYSDDGTREKYVFNHPDIRHWLVAMAIWGIFSLVFIYILYIESGTAILSDEYRSDSLYLMLISGLVLLMNVFLIKIAVTEVMFARRYHQYQNILKYKQVEIVDDLALMINKKNNYVERDLIKAVGSKLIPQGHFSRNKVAFMVSDRTYERYKEHRAEYDRYLKNFIEERNRMKTRSKETEDLLEQGREYVQKIRDCNDIIKDKDISDKLDRMEKVVASIFHEVDINPAQSDKLGVFMGYYLPTTEKLLESYIEMGERRVKGQALTKSQKDISSALDSINGAFESLLERFFVEQEIDIASDISAMETIMTQEGLVNNGIE